MKVRKTSKKLNFQKDLVLTQTLFYDLIIVELGGDMLVDGLGHAGQPNRVASLNNTIHLLISCFATNMISILKKTRLSTDSFVSNDPRVYEPFDYEM